jgi:hypothetical protein
MIAIGGFLRKISLAAAMVAAVVMPAVVLAKGGGMQWGGGFRGFSGGGVRSFGSLRGFGGFRGFTGVRRFTRTHPFAGVRSSSGFRGVRAAAMFRHRAFVHRHRYFFFVARWGLYRSGHGLWVINDNRPAYGPWAGGGSPAGEGPAAIDDDVSYNAPEWRLGYFPMTGREPAYGRREIEPGPDRRLPPPAPSYRRSWSAESRSAPIIIEHLQPTPPERDDASKKVIPF